MLAAGCHPKRDLSGQVIASICYREIPESPLKEAEARGHPQAHTRAGWRRQMSAGHAGY